MNVDLELRLQSFDTLTTEETSFWKYLCVELGKLAMQNNTGDRLEVTVKEIISPDDDTAYVEYDGDLFDVVIERRMPFGMCVDYLIHEYAHVMSWRYDERDDHGPRFGVAYATLYRRYLDLHEEFWEVETWKF